MTDDIIPANKNDAPPPKKILSDAAKRALKEAEERRQAEQAKAAEEPATEYGGRGGKDPSRFGDWEIDGRAIDF